MKALATRWTTTAHVGVVLGQIGAALAFLLGQPTGFRWHSLNAQLVCATAFLQLIVFIAAFRVPATKWQIIVALAILLCALSQLHLGRQGQLAAHLTIAVVLWGLSVSLLVRVWDPGWLGIRQGARP